MTVIGITGGTSVGKSTIVNCLAEIHADRISIFDADKVLNRLYSDNQNVIARIKALYPDAIIDGKVDKKILAGFYFASDENSEAVNKASIEEVRFAAKEFIEENEGKLVVFDMPMLIEVGIDYYCDNVFLVTAPYSDRKERASQKMSEELFEQIVKKQSGLPKSERDEISAEECTDIGDDNKRGALSSYVEIKNPNSQSIEQLSDLLRELV